MSTELPYAADAELSLSYDELEVRIVILSLHRLIFLQVLRKQYQKELAQNHVTIQTKFNFSWGLVKSPKREDQVEGIRLLQGLFSSSCQFSGAHFI
jgi:fission 1 protein